MKKLCLTILISGLLFTGFSQNFTENMLTEVGLFAAPGYSMICGGESWCGTLGFQVGMETQLYKLNENSSINTGVLFSMQGANYEESYDYEYFGLKSSVSENTYKGKVSLGYLAVPVLYNYLTNNGFYIEAGVQPGLLVSAKDKPEEGSSYDYKDYIKTIDIGLAGGAGYWFNESIGVGTRVVYGLLNINTEGTEMYSSEDNDHNVIIMAVARIKLNKN